MRIFLTGGTGFIGSHFINQAHLAGHEVVALRRSPTSTPRAPFVRDPEWIDKTMPQVDTGDLSGCDAVVHLAAHSANVPYDTLENCILENVIAPVTLFRTAITAGIRRFIIAGSCFEYGPAGERYEFIPPDAPLEPTASYPASKAAATMAFRALACENQLEMLVLRIFHTYGEGELESRFWPSLRRAALAGEDLPMTTGEQIRDFMPVEDVASAFVTAITRDDLKPGKPIIENLGTGRPQSIADFARAEWRKFSATGKLLFGQVPQRPNEVMRYVPKVGTAR